MRPDSLHRLAWRRAALIALAFAFGATLAMPACKTPTRPNDPISTPESLTKEQAAATAAQLVSGATIQLLKQAGGVSSNAAPASRFLRWLSRLEAPVSAQSRTWSWSCPTVGVATTNLPPFIGSVQLNNTRVDFSGCGVSSGNIGVNANGRVDMNGNFYTTDASQTNIRLSGDIGVSCDNGGCPPFIGMDGTTNGNGNFIGNVGGTPILDGRFQPTTSTSTTSTSTSTTSTSTSTTTTNTTVPPTTTIPATTTTIPRTTTTTSTTSTSTSTSTSIPTTTTVPGGTFSVTPSETNVGTISFCGGSASATFTVTASSNVSWSLRDMPIDIPNFTATANRYNGTGSSSVTVTLRYTFSASPCPNTESVPTAFPVTFVPSSGSPVTVLINYIFRV